MTNEISVKIMVGYHKPFTLFKSDILVPIHCGRDVAMEISKDGQLDKLDLAWLVNNMVGDNTGDNISKENRYINEMTGIYWAWKNYDTLGNPDYIGFLQHGKHLIFNPYMEIARTPWIPGVGGHKYEINSYLRNDNLSEKYIYPLLAEFDCLCARKFDVSKLKTSPENCRARLKELSGEKGVQAFDLMCEIIRKDYPKYIPQLEQIEKGSIHYPANVFVMKRELFKNYAEFVFGVVLEMLKRADFSGGTFFQQRAPAFCAELLTSVYIHSLEKDITKELFLAVLNKPISRPSLRCEPDQNIKARVLSESLPPPPSHQASLTPLDKSLTNLLYATCYKREKYRYYRYCILSRITLGKRRKKYLQKRQQQKKLLIEMKRGIKDAIRVNYIS